MAPMSGTRLNIEQPDELKAYLIAAGHIEPAAQIGIKILPGGVSNRTVRVKLSGGETWVIKQALSKLRVAVDWFSDPMRVHREAQGLRWYACLTPENSVPAFLFEDFTHHVLAMRAVPAPHWNWKEMLLAGQLEADHIDQFARILGSVHARASLQRDQLEPLFADRTFFESLRLEPYYRYTATQVPAAAHFIDELIVDTRRQALTLVHGDYSPKNVLVYQNRLVLLDFEVAHFGDPGFDLGFACTHLLSKAHHLPLYRMAFTEAAKRFWHSYQQALGTLVWREALEPRAVRHTLACLLARVAGRSPLEYLSGVQRVRQREAVLALMPCPPQKFDQLCDDFIAELEKK